MKRDKRNESCFFYNQQVLHYLDKSIHKSLKKSVILFNRSENAYLGHSDEGIHCFHLGQKGIKSSNEQIIIDKSLVVTDICPESQKVILDHERGLKKKQVEMMKLNFKKNFDYSKPRQLYIKFEDGPFHQAFVFFGNNDTALVEFPESVHNKGRGHVATFYNTPSKNAKILGSGIVRA